MKTVSIAIFVIVLFSKFCYADLSTPFPNGDKILFFEGKISKNEYNRFYDFLKVLYKEGKLGDNTIQLNSVGGDVLEAIKIGKLIRELKLDTATSPGGRCISACSLIYYSGTQRTILDLPSNGQSSPLGIHRPRFDPSYFSGLSLDEADRKYKEMSASVKSYMEEMEVPSQIIEKTFSTPSTDVYMIPYNYAISNLSGTVPSFEEWMLAKCGDYSLDEQKIYSQIKLTLMLNKISPNQLKENYRHTYLKVKNIEDCNERIKSKETRKIAKEIFN